MATKPGHPRPPARDSQTLPAVFAAIFGAFLGLTLLKFGNPPIMEKWVTPPVNGYDFVLGYPWPINWAYWLLALICVTGLFAARGTKLSAPLWLVALPLAWLIWQFAAAFHTIEAQLSIPTVKHFVACAACFYLGLFPSSRARPLWPFGVGICVGFLLVLAFGFEQHFGGLAEARRYFWLYQYPQLTEIPQEYVKKISSDRIWSTLFYPNTLAGVVLLLLPPLIGVIATARERFTAPARWFLGVSVAVSALACLYWSGSKGGWLLMLLIGLAALLRFPLGKTVRVGLVGLVLIGGLAGFFWKYSAFFKKGATSVGARFDYWRAAVQVTGEHPLLGTGPGTFARPYERIKRPESEMTRMVHNDYLEQASDSGVPGFLIYSAFVVCAVFWAYPRVPSTQTPVVTQHSKPRSDHTPDPAPGSRIPEPNHWRWFALWLGVLGWALQGLFEFSLYIPALTWSAFAFLGLLLARARRRAA